MPSPSQYAAMPRFLSRLLLRSQLSDEERRAILDLPAQSRQVGPNHDIIQPGGHTDEATLVAHGMVARYDAMKDGERQITAFYIPGDMCDLHSVVSPTAGWGLMGLVGSIILSVPHSALKKLAVTHPAIAMAFWRDTTVDGSILSKWVGNVGRRTAKARIAHVICEMGIRSEGAELGTRDCFPLNVTQFQLADAVGLTAVHVNRTLQDLRRDNLISTLARTVTVPHWQRLAEVAEFDPTYLLLPRNEHRAGTASHRTLAQVSPIHG